MMVVEYFPPGGSQPIKFGDDGWPLAAPGLIGSKSTLTSPVVRRATGQRGGTQTDRDVPGRTVAVQVLYEGGTVEDVYDAWDLLAGTLAGSPSMGDIPAIGLLRVHRPGRPTVETRADPVDSPQEARWISPLAALIDIEWFCPSPLWRSTVQQSVVLSLVPSEPWTSPWESPWESPAATDEAEVVNGGHVPVGPVVRFFGPQSEAALTNVSTGETMRVFGSIDAGEVVEVDTDARTVKLDGVPILGRWDFSGSWWQLRKGSQQVRASALSASGDARTVVLWRDAYAGV